MQADNFETHANVFACEQVMVSHKIVINGTEYREGTVVIVSGKERLLVFGKIRCIICDNLEKPLLFVTL